MTHPRLLTAAFTILIGISLVMVAHAATPRSLVTRVDRVADGDSVTATTSEATKLRIRFLGSNAPRDAPGRRPHIASGEGCSIC